MTNKANANKGKKKARQANDQHIRQVVKKEIAREIEVKYFDRSITGNIDSTSLHASNLLNGIVRGTGTGDYIGSSIKPKSVELRGQMIAADVPGNWIRVIIIQDGSVSGTPVIGTMFQNASHPLYSPFNKNFTDTYRVLYDRMTLCTNDGVTGNGFLAKSFRVFISGKKLRGIKFLGATGAVDSGTLWWCAVSDSSASAHPTFTLLSRVNYTDA